MARRQHACWSNQEAEQRIHTYAHNANLELAYTAHAKSRMKIRNIIIADVMYILAHGRVSDAPEAAARAGYFKYNICAQSPNSGGREICVVVIPDPVKPAIKIITVMWKDLR